MDLWGGEIDSGSTRLIVNLERGEVKVGVRVHWGVTYSTKVAALVEFGRVEQVRVAQAE